MAREQAGIYATPTERVNKDRSQLPQPMHATAFLKSRDTTEIPPIAVLHGGERHLKHAVLEALRARVLGETGDIGFTRFGGKETDALTVFDELRTISMWGDRRLVLVDDAEDFVSKNRTSLEKYLDKPARKSVLLLDVKTWPKTTRLAKLVAKMGLEVECKELSAGDLTRWLCEAAQEQHGKQLSRDAASLMVQLAGTDLGLLDSELAKLAAYVGESGRIEVDAVRTLVGGWKAETTWTMLDALRDGRINTALGCLDKLLIAGEAPQRILGGIQFVFRRLAQATQIASRGVPLKNALRQAGVFPRDLDSSEAYLRRIGRNRAEQIFHLLLSADGGLKGNSRTPERVQLEMLLIELGGRSRLN
jgi:DNA polymerase-3 subunit delta